jgi:hypothetical protein
MRPTRQDVVLVPLYPAGSSRSSLSGTDNLALPIRKRARKTRGSPQEIPGVFSKLHLCKRMKPVNYC